MSCEGKTVGISRLQDFGSYSVRHPSTDFVQQVQDNINEDIVKLFNTWTKEERIRLGK